MQETIDEVRQGYKTVAVVPLSVALLLERSEENLFATIPADGNKNLISGAAVLNGPNNAAAGKFIEYLLSNRAAEIVAEKGHGLVWSLSAAADDELRSQYTGKMLTPVDDLSWTAGRRPMLLNAGLQQAKKYNKVLGIKRAGSIELPAFKFIIEFCICSRA